MPNTLKPYAKQLTIIVITFTLLILAWANLFLNINLNANVATLDGVGDRFEGQIKQANRAFIQIKRKAKQNIDLNKFKSWGFGDLGTG